MKESDIDHQSQKSSFLVKSQEFSNNRLIETSSFSFGENECKSLSPLKIAVYGLPRRVALQKGELNYKQRPTDDHAEYGHEEHSFGYPSAQ